MKIFFALFLKANFFKQNKFLYSSEKNNFFK